MSYSSRRISFALTLAIATVAVLALSQSAEAGSGTWNANVSDVWSNSARWTGGTIADGATSTGDFSTVNLTATRTVTIDGAVASRTLGIIKFGDATTPDNHYVIAASGGGTLTFDNGGSNAQINETSTSTGDTISAPILLKSSLDITNVSGNTLTLSTGGITSSAGGGTQTISLLSGNATISGIIGNGVTGGTVAVNQGGSGTLALGTTANTYTGGTTISAGKITIGGSGTPLGSAGLTLSGGTLVSSANRSVAAATNVSVTADSASRAGENASPARTAPPSRT